MRRFSVIAIASVAIVMAGFGNPAIASAVGECPHRFGSNQQLVDAGGAVVQEWTVTDLKKSAGSAPGYPLAGQLWEATASVEAVSGTVTPIIPNFRAHAADGASYPVLWQVSSAEGIPGATITQGQTATGKLYFDATGADPVAVTYAGGGAHPSMMWCCGEAMMAMPMDMMMDMPMPMGMMDNCPHCRNQ
ncbi:DUF1942 domain-containing protein [Mycolicibacterium novocastrense]|uniref:MPT63-like domain-containing protein n=2 Tax=Mycolicibacterium novocastrense TaxID=59813 RepID=A0ABQ0KEK8_MYCNV|nr:Domain of unknown function [Mycolicibacterium novocastrense]